MFCTGRVEYDGRVIILIGVNIGRIFLRVYVIVPASVAAIIIVIVIFIILSRDVVLISLDIVWIGVGVFMMKYIKDFQRNWG